MEIENVINLKSIKNDVHEALPQLHGVDPNGNEFSFTNHYMVRDGHPFFGICGEFHFSRYNCDEWEDELIKMKMGGVNIVPTYVIWNHHEEVKDQFIWSGNKDLRRFVKLCKKHGLDVILRIGPWDHGEVRNGGYPDWLYGEPLEVRSNDKLYLHYVEKLYEEIGKQVHGLFFENGGPIIGIQLENEFQHAGASWEITTGTSDEWIPAGHGGNEHIKSLLRLTKKVGMNVPIYTGTAWGGAVAETDTVLPLWGGYAFWPWIFYDKNVKEHPATPEYIYRDYRYPTYNFDPTYNPKEVPYAACEMGGGMTVFYSYRFKLPYQSVDAMTNVKVASGCNFVGYYVYHGGSNPRGIKTPYLNEAATPKINYDYQAVLGQFGQPRESYYRLKRQHYFFKDFQNDFCPMETVLPEGAQDIDPTDDKTLRYSVRQKDGKGFIFLNNYQDHIKGTDKEHEVINLELDNESLRVPFSGTFGLKNEESCILPFNFDMDGILIKTATVQLITKVESKGESYYFFYQPRGMEPELALDSTTIDNIDSEDIESYGDHIVIRPVKGELTNYKMKSANGKKVNVYVMTSQQSLDFWKFNFAGKDNIALSASPLLADGNNLKMESNDSNVKLTIFKALKNPEIIKNMVKVDEDKLTETYEMEVEKVNFGYKVVKVNDKKMSIHIDTTPLDSSRIKDCLLEVDYEGDIGYAFYEDKLINDDYSNGRVWDIGLKHNVPETKDTVVNLTISPIRKDHYVKSDSPMAARSEENEGEVANINEIKLTPIYKFNLISLFN